MDLEETIREQVNRAYESGQLTEGLEVILGVVLEASSYAEILEMLQGRAEFDLGFASATGTEGFNEHAEDYYRQVATILSDANEAVAKAERNFFG